MKKFILSFFVPATLFFVAFTHTAHAVIPPDFIYNIGSQIANFFSIIAIFFVAIFATSYQFIKNRFHSLKNKWIFIGISLISILAVAYISSYYYGQYREKQEYEKWLNESLKQQEGQASSLLDLSKTEVQIAYKTSSTSAQEESQINPLTGSVLQDKGDQYIDQTKLDPNDQLEISDKNLPNPEKADTPFTSILKTTDQNALFIENYYKNIAEKNLEAAYEVSKKSVDLETFKSWYEKTTAINLEKIIKIDDIRYSLELTLYEDKTFTKYGVLITLKIENGTAINIQKSEVKILSQGEITETGATTKISRKAEEKQYSFFEDYKSKPLIITNENFEKETTARSPATPNYIVIDARENLEYENGNFPNSLHIRFADLKAGRWIELPNDKFIYVLCWSGIRGKEVAEFLRTKKLVASYLEGGANGWVEYGGDWIGNIKFAEKYMEEKYRITYTTDETKEKVENGAFLVDCREPYKFEKSHIEGSISLPIMYTPSSELEKVFAQIPEGKEVITICDGYVNCFDAKITGVEIEKRNHVFLGRYNKPWEW